MLALALLHRESFSWSEWVLYPDFLIGWLLLGGAYLLCAGPLRHRFADSRPVSAAQVGSFTFALLLMLVALQGPLHEPSHYFLFSAHMVSHLVISQLLP